MKKIYLSLVGALVTAGSFSQAPVLNKSNHKEMPARFNKQINFVAKESNNSSRATTISNEPLNAIDGITTAYGYGSPYLAVTNPMWPDSNTMINFTGGPSGAWLHGVAQVFDLEGFAFKTTTFNPGTLPFDPATAMTIDSIFMQGFYVRENPDQTVVDTARFHIVSANGNFSSGAYFGGNPDSAKLVIGMDNTLTNEYTGVLGTFDVLLDSAAAADTLANGSKFLELEANLNLTGHQGLIGVIMEYVPGIVPTTTDTIFVNTNYFSPVYCTPGGQSTTYPNGIAPDHTIGQFHDNNSKYNPALDYMLPAVAFNGDHPYQLYNMTINVSQNNNLTASIDELDNGAELFQSYPNPTAGLTTIKYSLEEAAQVSFEVMDITGKTVFASVEGNKANGVHAINLDTKDFNAGVYFYSVVVNGNKLTKKMTVTK